MSAPSATSGRPAGAAATTTSRNSGAAAAAAAAANSPDTNATRARVSCSNSASSVPVSMVLDRDRDGADAHDSKDHREQPRAVGGHHDYPLLGADSQLAQSSREASHLGGQLGVAQRARQ